MNRTDHIRLLLKLLNPLRQWYDENDSVLHLPDEVYTPNGIQTARLEAFSRLLLGWALCDDDTAGIGFKEKLLAMIRNGVDPERPTYWGSFSDYDHKNVELFPILFYCYRNKDLFEQLFTERDKHNLSTWFLQVNHVKVYHNNWLFFRILTNLFLQRLGLEYSQEAIDKAFEEIDGMYLGNGWYRDGESLHMDYYIPFAFHYYSLIYAYYSDDKERNAIIQERSKAFAKSYIYFFADDGRFAPYGRSLTYKFAPLAFWAMYLLFVSHQRQEQLIIKGIIDRNLSWWSKQDIMNADGTLRIGFAYENPYMRERYNGKGSSYWCLKAFFFLLLRQDAPFFTESSLPLPQLKTSLFIPEARLIIQRHEGNVYLFINGQKSGVDFGNTIAKYEKFVYSSRFGFCVSRPSTDLKDIAPDNTLAIKWNNLVLIRHNAYDINNTTDYQSSTWQPIKGITIRTTIIPDMPLQIRIHEIRSSKRFELFDFGFASDNAESACKMYGWHGNSAPNLLKNQVLTNVYYPGVSYLPYLSSHIPPGHYFVINFCTIDRNSLMNDDVVKVTGNFFTHYHILYKQTDIKFAKGILPYTVLDSKVTRAMRRLRGFILSTWK